MRVHGTGLTTVETVEGCYFCGGRCAAADDGLGWLQLFQKEL